MSSNPGALAQRNLFTFLRKLLMGIAFGLALLLGIFFLVANVESWRGTRKWQALKKELESRGEVLDLLATKPPPVPDEQNFARHPLIAKIFTRHTNDVELSPSVLPRPALADPEHDKSASGPSLKRKERRAVLQQWSNYYTGHSQFPQAPAGASPAEVVRTALKKYDPEIQALLQAAGERPRCRYPLDYQQGAMLLLPHLGEIKNLIQTLQLRALADLHLGETEKAFAELRLGFFLSDTLREEPLLISFLVRLAVDSLLWDVVKEGLNLRQWSEPQLAWLVDYLGRRDYLAEYLAAMRGERNFAIYITEMIRQGRIRETLDPEMSGGGELALKAVPAGILYHNTYYLVKMYHDYILRTAEPKTRLMDREMVEQFQDSLRVMGRSPYTIMAQLLMPALTKTAVRVAQWQTIGDATMLACAVERHRLANGSLPATLEELAPRYLPFVPKDVLNGAPLVYKITGTDSFLIYTFGWDEKDDQGGADPNLEKGDWGVEIGPPDQTSTR